MLYSFSLRLRVRREMPSCSAASVRWPPVRSSALMIICSSMLSRLPTGRDAVWRSAVGSPVSAALSREKSISVACRLHRHLGHQVAQFANVARPRVREQRRNGLRRKILARSLQAQEMFRQRNNILRPLAQRRHAQLELAEAMKQILAEAAVLHCGFQILVGRGDDAHVNFDLAVPAQTVERLTVEHAQQFDLSLQLQFADFVEEQRSLVGQFEQPGLGRIGAAESAFFISEEFALDEILGKRRAVDVDPRPAAAMRRLVNRCARSVPCRFRFRR